MVRKLTAGSIFLIASLLTHPVVAEPLGQPARGLGVTIDLQAPVNQELQPEEGTAREVDKIDLNYVKEYPYDAGKIFTSPLHWEAKDWLKAGLVLGVTSSLFLVDQNVKNFALSHQSPVASKFALAGNDLGNGLYTVPAVGAFYLYGYLGDDHKARRASLLALESYALSGILTESLKMAISRHRPNTGDAPMTFDGPSLSAKNVSFCSGHTSSAFSIATVFADVYKDNPFVPPLAYGLATLTGLSRVYSNEHWSSDVFFGAALGYFTSKALLKYHREDQDSFAKRLTVLPTVSKEMTGVTVKYDF